jgi:hypothetical protein
MIGGILYVLCMFFFSENDFWFELIISTFYLLTYIALTIQKFPGQFHLSGMLIGLATLVKPTAAIIVIPILVFKKHMSILIGFLFIMSMTGIYFASVQGLSDLLDANFGYNAFLGKFYRPIYILDDKLIFSVFGIICISIVLAIINASFRKIILPLLFIGSSVIFLSSGYARVRMVPIMTFFPILISTTISTVTNRWKISYILLLCVFTLAMGYKVYQHHLYLLTHRQPYIEQKDGQNIVTYITTHKIKGTFFILGNVVQPYFILDQLPPTYIPLRYPMVEQYYPDYEERLIRNIEKNAVRYIFIPRPNEFSWNGIPAYIDKNYSRISKTETLDVYRKN